MDLKRSMHAAISVPIRYEFAGQLVRGAEKPNKISGSEGGI